MTSVAAHIPQEIKLLLRVNSLRNYVKVEAVSYLDDAADNRLVCIVAPQFAHETAVDPDAGPPGAARLTSLRVRRTIRVRAAAVPGWIRT